MQCMYCEKLFDIWCVFRILEFVVYYGDFICVTCILLVVKALSYYSDGPGIDSRWCHCGFFSWYHRQNHVP